MSIERVGQVAVRLPDGRVLVTGGEDGDAYPLQTAETFSLRTGRWSAIASMPEPATEQAASVLPSGLVLVTGGVVNGRVSHQVLLYDPRRNRWRLAASMKHARANHASVVLPGGDVLVAGGSSAFAEIYDPRLNRWRPAGHPGARLFPATVRVGRSSVLLAGGEDVRGGCLATAQLYSRGTGWRRVPSMESRRCTPLSTALPNGRAIVGGGFNKTTSPTLQMFDPVSMTWMPFPSLPGPRAAGTMTYLGSSIVAAGGTVDGEGISSSVSLHLNLTARSRAAT